MLLMSSEANKSSLILSVAHVISPPGQPLNLILTLSGTRRFILTQICCYTIWGAGLDDRATEGSAETYEWRTPPLWGLGLSADSQGGELFLMHDGRAKTVEEAILMHGGEASTSRDSFEQLSETDKQKLLTFLKSL
jgi:hypothetical protein